MDIQAIEKIETSLKEKADHQIEKGIWDPYSSQWNRASELGTDCDTFHALVRMKGNIRPRATVAREKVFRRGREWETPNIRLLQDAGIDLKDRIGMYEWPAFLIRGKLDSWVSVPELGDYNIPFEIKTCSPNVFRSVRDHREQRLSLTRSKFSWIRKYPGQLQVYMLQMGVEWGLWFFFDVVSGDYFFWLIPLDLEYSEVLLQRAERANKNVKEATIPKPEYKDICDKCDFALCYCYPDKDFGPGWDLVVDDDLEARVKRFISLDKDYREYTGLKKDLIGDGKKPGLLYGRNMIIGDCRVKSSERKSVWYAVPDKVKAPYKRETKYFITDIEELQGGGE